LLAMLGVFLTLRISDEVERESVHYNEYLARQVVEAFEQELGVAPGETTDDGSITLRTVECLGGCGYATVVAVDNRYREHISPEDVPAIVEGVRGA